VNGGLRIERPKDLARAMKLDYVHSDEQWAAISAPLEPAVVIAGAGSGKTTVMAARVVYLVLTGQVRPEQVLGLTFTTKAASELRHKIIDALTTAGALDLLGPASDPPTEAAEDVLEPTVATYNAYAANLLTDHGLRIGHEPDTRVITDAVRYQLGARAITRYTAPIEFLTEASHPVICLMDSQRQVTDMGGTMRLGADPVKLHPDTKAREIYGEAVIYERHRHRYEVNNFLRKRLEHAGLVFSGTSPDDRLVEVIELPDHPFFVASQYHPEFKSRPLRPQPLFREFVGAALERAGQRAPEVEPQVRAESHA
jgi:hypothetical protein